MASWFENTLIGQYAAEKERRFFARHMEAYGDVRSVQFGQAWLRPSEKTVYIPEDIKMNAAAMAWDTHTLDMLLLPHSHEFSDAPLMVLAEASRVLKPHGKLVLTGFNPHSLWCCCRWFDGKILPKRENCFSLPRFKRYVRQFGFEIEYGQFMVYVPPVQKSGSLKFWRFLEKAGDRWWPQFAAVYGLVLVKRVACVTPLPEFEAEIAEQPVVLGIARMRNE